MNEWLTTGGLDPSERNFIQELEKIADRGEAMFLKLARDFFEMMPVTVMSAISKARQQDKCKEWPSA